MKGPAFFDESFLVIKEENALLLERLKRILLTLPGERVGNTEFGSSLKMYLFESEATVSANLPNILRADIKKWDPTVDVRSVDINLDEEHIAKINIILIKKETGEIFDYDLSLEY